jgi:hypothetical protein
MTNPTDDDLLTYEYFVWCMADHRRARRVLCPQCGGLTPELHEGLCHPCFGRNQAELDRHIAEFDRWERLTPAQRDDEIRNAC